MHTTVVSNDENNANVVFEIIVTRNGKIVYKHGLELVISGVAIQEIHQNGKIVTFVSNCSVKMTLKLF